VAVLVLCAALSSVGATQGQTVGLFLNEPGSFNGYTLFAPFGYGTTYLIDNDGGLIHSWDSDYNPMSAYLLENGNLLRTARLADSAFRGGGETGRVEEFAWDGTLVWEFEYASDEYMLHHDLEVLPNGNVLMIAWEHKTAAEAIAAGRDPALLEDGELWPEHIIEVEPAGATGGNIVWEWHAWDHLIQDFDPTKDNYGVVADHPELIDINYIGSIRPPDGESDWHHANSIDYNPEFDQIILSVRHFDEFWVIDHSTTTAEAAGHSEGNSGKGGDLLYRWGNPEAYGAGDAGDRRLFAQHDAQWIEPGLPGAGNILVFNNGPGRPDGLYSSVDEIVPPADSSGNYSLTPGQAYGPVEQTWIYTAANPTDFYSAIMGGALRLPNGNTLIDESVSGTFFEVTPQAETVWKYVNPVTAEGPLTQGASIPDFGPFALANIAFRAERYAPDYVGLQGRDLTPGQLIELADSDKDGLSDQDEVDIHGTDPLNPDTDSDGCVDGAELRPESVAATGGGRDPLYFWDFMDQWTGTPFGRDRVIVGGDISAVVARFGTIRGTAPTKAEALAEALTPPVDTTSYHPIADRGPGLAGPNPWNRTPPDGSIVGGDIGAIVAQFGHSCAPLPPPP
jgi:hypothetical protein